MDHHLSKTDLFKLLSDLLVPNRGGIYIETLQLNMFLLLIKVDILGWVIIYGAF